MAPLRLVAPLLAALALAAAGPSPSCMLNGLPCPVPVGWRVEWALINSTAIMPTGPARFEPSPAHKWGLASLDWGVGAANWLRNGAANADCEAVSTANCADAKRNGSIAFCSIYHNIELSLEWLESQRAVMDDAHVAAGWFLRWPNGSVYNEPTTMLGVELRQYFTDWRNADAARYFVGAIVQATLNGAVDGTFTDDREGLPNEHPDVVRNCNLTDAEVAALQFATQSAGQYLATSLALSGKWCWDCPSGENLLSPPSRTDPASCAAAMPVAMPTAASTHDATSR